MISLDPATPSATFMTRSGYLGIVNLVQNTYINTLVYQKPGGFRMYYATSGCTGKVYAVVNESIFDIYTLGGAFMACGQGKGGTGTCTGAFVKGALNTSFTPWTYMSTTGVCTVVSAPTAGWYYEMTSLGPDGTGEVPAGGYTFCKL